MDPNNTPALDPPPGVEPNFIDPYSKQPERIALATVGLTVVAVSVAARIYTRSLLKKFGIDDYVLLLAMAGFVTFTALLLVAGECGDGTHQWNVTLAELRRNLFIGNIAEIIYAVAMFTLKYVVLRQIELMFFGHNRRTFASRLIVTLIWANLFIFVSLFFVFMFACVPRESIWNREVEGGCINSPALITVGSSLNVISDTTILLVPIVAVWQLQMPLKNKIKTTTVFAVGIFATIASIVRLYYGLQLFYTDDVTWAMSPVGQWTIAEFTTGFLVACCPYFPRLFDHIKGKDKRAAYNPSHADNSFGSKNQATRARADRQWTVLSGHEENDKTLSRTMILSDLPSEIQGVTDDVRGARSLF